MSAEQDAVSGRDVVAAVEAATRQEIVAELRAANFSLGASLVSRGSDDPEATLKRIRASVEGGERP